jgi:YggT family protein
LTLDEDQWSDSERAHTTEAASVLAFSSAFDTTLVVPEPTTLLVWSLLGVFGLLVNIYFFALLGMIILSWVAAGSRHPAIYLLYQITEPVMAPFRKVLPAMGGLDFSPILVFILINIIQIALRHMAQAAGLHPALVLGI